MSAWISAAKEKFLLWWLVIFYVCVFSLSSLCTAIIAALYGMRWNEVETQDKVMVCLLVFVNWSTVMLAFANKAIGRVQKGELPISQEDDQPPNRTVASPAKTEVVSGP